ncbi:MAG: N-acetyltransferase [Actinomycetes bacterium]
MTEVRAEQAGDAPAIRAVLGACFPTEAEARLVELLRADFSLPVSLVADQGGELIGHVAFSPVSLDSHTEAGAVRGAGLAPLAVLEAHRRQGVGTALACAGLDACATAGFGWIVVLGDPRYYARFGFRPAAEAGLHDEYGGGPAFQVLELRPGSLPVGAGLVRYSPEFASLG